MSGIVVEAYDPAIGGRRKLLVYRRLGRLVVRPWDPNWDSVPPTRRSLETRLVFAEGARLARGATGFVDGLPRSSVVTGAYTRRKMAESPSPRRNARQERADRNAALIGSELLEEAERLLDASSPPGRKSRRHDRDGAAPWEVADGESLRERARRAVLEGPVPGAGSPRRLGIFRD